MRIIFMMFVSGIVLSVHTTGLVAQSLPGSSSPAIESTTSVPRPTALISRAGTRPGESETERRMNALEDELRLQKTELEQLRKITEDQQLTIRSLMERLNASAGVGASNPGNASSEVAGPEKRETTDNSSAKVDPQSLVFVQKQLRNSGDFPNFFVPLGAFAPRTYRVQQQLVFSF